MDSSGIKVPKCMSTQHPDNVHSPFFSDSAEIGGEDEIREAYYAFSHLGCDEQMWDCEGKEVDSFVIKKLLSKYPSYFEENVIGRDVFLTLRVPNPTVERTEAKILLETLESIPRSFDTSKLFYRDTHPPIFEVIMPMTSSSKCLDRVYRYYRDYVVGKEHHSFTPGDITISEWIGEFLPERINVIPLVEDLNGLMNAAEIVREYVADKDLEYQRVMLARSDPALNYGLLSAVLLNKIALMRLHHLSEDIGMPIYPIIGMGSAPFRGNLRPDTVEKVMQEYPSVHTLTAQSSFKYDHRPDEVREGVRAIEERRRYAPHDLDAEWALDFIDRYSAEYRKQIMKLAPMINQISKHVPSRRKRKLHIGLFGYSRSMEGVSLPRAIRFTASLYSMGIPPELLGINVVTEDDMEMMERCCPRLEDSIKAAMEYLNPHSYILLPEELVNSLRKIPIDHEVNEPHNAITEQVVSDMKRKQSADLDDLVLRAANIRGFLG